MHYEPRESVQVSIGGLQTLLSQTLGKGVFWPVWAYSIGCLGLGVMPWVPRSRGSLKGTPEDFSSA